MSVSERILELLSNDKKYSQKELAKYIGVAPSTLSNWLLKNRDIPPAKLVLICEYFEVPIGYLLGVEKDDEEQAKSPNEKLAIQMALNCVTLSQLSKEVGVTEGMILHWLMGDTEFSKYYDRLSEVFEITPTYWVRPGMISPGIEPTLDEYLLIILFREYRQTGELKEDLYGSLHDYFPTVFAEGSSPLVGVDPELLQMIRRLNKEEQIELRGYIRGVYGRSVAADPPEAPSGKMAK